MGRTETGIDLNDLQKRIDRLCGFAGFLQYQAKVEQGGCVSGVGF